MKTVSRPRGDASALSFRMLALMAAFAMLLCACGTKTTPSRTPALSPSAPTIGGVPATLTPDTSAQVAEVLAAPVPEGVDAALWDMLRNELATQLTVREASRYKSAYPWGTLQLSSVLEGDQAYLVWDNTFFHWDGNGDGKVWVSDLAPLAQHYGARTNSVPSAGVADYNWDGIVNVADVTTLAIHFGEECSGFVIQQSSTARGAGYTDVGTLGYLETSSTDENGYGVYRFPAAFSDDIPLWVQVVALDGEGNKIDRSPMTWRTYACEGNTPKFPVDDLDIVSESPPTLTWTTHFFAGDGDRNGVINIVDMATPIAIAWTAYGIGCSVADFPGAAVADYDRSGYVDYFDMEAVAFDWGLECAGFNIEVSQTSPNDGYVVNGTMLYLPGSGKTEGGFTRYEYEIASPPVGVPFWVRVTPYDYEDKLGLPSAAVEFGGGA